MDRIKNHFRNHPAISSWIIAMGIFVVSSFINTAFMLQFPIEIQDRFIEIILIIMNVVWIIGHIAAIRRERWKYVGFKSNVRKTVYSIELILFIIGILIHIPLS